jgi:hypothetical protein
MARRTRRVEVTQRRPGWYGTARPRPDLVGWMDWAGWIRAHYFAGESLPLCRKAARSTENLKPASVDLPRCGHCRRSLAILEGEHR